MSSTDRVGWYVALITGVLAVLSFLGLDKQSRAWICRESEGRFLCDKVQLEDVQVKMFALDYCYLHANSCADANSVSTNPLASNSATAMLNESLRSIGNPDWIHNPPDNLRFYVPNHNFPRGTGRKYLLYWEINFNVSGLDHPVRMRIMPYLYMPVATGAEGYYGDPYDKTYLETDSMDFVLKPGQEKASRLLTVDSGQSVRLEDVNEWPVGLYSLKFKIESEQAEVAHKIPIESTFQLYQLPVYPDAPLNSYSMDNYQYSGY